MSEPVKRHPFIDDLGENVILETSILRAPIRGRDLVLKVVKAGAGRYVTQKTRFLGAIGERSFFEYDAVLVGGVAAVGLVSILRDAAGAVTHLHIAFSPLDAVLSIAVGVQGVLADELGADLFVHS